MYSLFHRRGGINLPGRAILAEQERLCVCVERQKPILRHHLADLVQGILSVSIRVFKVVMCGERAVDVSGNDGFLSRVLQHTRSGTRKRREQNRHF